MPRAARHIGTRAAPAGAEAHVATLAAVWGELLQEVASLAAHEIKGALNGVSINLEVVRAKAAQPGAPAAGVAQFADAAAGQLDLTVKLIEGLLALARAPRESADLVGMLERLAVLLDPVARVDGGGITIMSDADGLPAATVADSGMSRAVLAGVLLDVVREGRLATCRVAGGLETTVRIRCADGRGTHLPARVAPISQLAGIRVAPDPQELILVFPRSAGTREEA